MLENPRVTAALLRNNWLLDTYAPTSWDGKFAPLEKACVKRLESIVWPGSIIICPRCKALDPKSWTNNRRRHGWRCQSCPKRFTSFEHLGPLAGNHQPAALLFGFIRAIDADPFVTYEILGDELGIGTSVASTLRHKVLSLQVVLADRETRMREVPRLPKDFFRRIIRGPRADPAPRRRRQPANDWPAANRQAEEHQTL